MASRRAVARCGCVVARFRVRLWLAACRRTLQLSQHTFILYKISKRAARRHILGKRVLRRQRQPSGLELLLLEGGLFSWRAGRHGVVRFGKIELL